jgi:hypothetical protein
MSESDIFQNGYDPKYQPISEQVEEAINVIFKPEPTPPAPTPQPPGPAVKP